MVIRVTPAVHCYTGKKEKKTFLIYKEIQIGSVAKVIYKLRMGFLKMLKYILYVWRPLVIYDFATDPF